MQDPPLDYAKRNNRSTVFRIVPKFKKEKVQKHKTSPQPGMCFEITRKIVAFEQYVILFLLFFFFFDKNWNDVLHQTVNSWPW